MMNPIATLCLATALITPLASAWGAEFQADVPQDAPGDFACHAALAEGFGGLVVWERGLASDAPLAIYGQWIDAAFEADGPEVVISAHAQGPMWRPRVVLTNPDEALVIWADGREHSPLQGPYGGFQIRGAVLKRGASGDSVQDFQVVPPGSTIEPVMVRDRMNERVAMGWVGSDNRFQTAVYPLERLAEASGGGALTGGKRLPPAWSLCALALTGEGHLARFHQWRFGEAHVEVFDTATAEKGGETPVAFDFLKSVLAPQIETHGGGYFHDYATMTVNRNGDIGVAGAICRSNDSPARFEVVGYAASVIPADGGKQRTAYWIGAVPTEVNVCRPAIAFSGDEPVLFLPIRPDPAKADVSLLVTVLPAAEAEDRAISEANGDLYPLPAELNQFSVILADDGATGKAALVATSGSNPSRLGVWPSELIGF